MKEADLIIHAVDEALQQGLLPVVAGSLHMQCTGPATACPVLVPTGKLNPYSTKAGQNGMTADQQ